MRPRKISSEWTKPMLIINVALGIGLSINVLHFDFKLTGSHIFGLFLNLSAIALNIYLVLKLTEVTLHENELRFKRLLGPERIYSFTQIGFTSSFMLKLLQFTKVDMHDEEGKVEKFLILNNLGLFSGENKDAKKILNGLRRTSR